MKLYDRTWTRRELEARVGNMAQVGGVRRWRCTEGKEDGAELVQVRTGGGLSYNVCPSRALDISLAEFAGVPFSWQAQNGDVHPAHYDPTGLEWLRTAQGGLLMTCGLSQVGMTCEEQDASFGLHGRIHHTPASQVYAEGRWDGDDYELRVGGVVEETRIFGECQRLRREIRSRLGENRIQIHDVVENMGFQDVPHMILYHFNFGFPLLSEGTEILIPSRSVVPRDEGTPVEGYDRWQAPEPGLRERVYYHEDMECPDPAGTRATAVVRNGQFPVPGGARALEVRLTWSTAQLPVLVQWKMPGAGEHVLGLEPANCRVGGRVAERERGTLTMLPPGESRSYDIELEVATVDVTS